MLDAGLAALLEKPTSCHSEQREESGFFAGHASAKIPRFARDDHGLGLCQKSG